jgi:SAM-dependent methyltransferase
MPANLEKYYPRDYYSFGKFDEHKFLTIRGKFKLQQIKKWITAKSVTPVNSSKFTVYDLLGRFGINPDSRILDVGSGNGKFLYPLSLLGYKNVLSVDPYISENYEYSNGYKVLKSELKDVPGKWDFINLCHSFEHIWTPDDVLKNIREKLTDNGFCFISVPVINSLAWKEFGTFWYQLDAPRHFYLHSPQSMEILAGRHGFKIVDTVYNSNYLQFFISQLYSQGITMSDIQKHKGNFLVWKMKKWHMVKKANIANINEQGDQAIFVLKRK